MKEKKNIEQWMQERFKDFEPTAPAGAWDNIEKRLDKRVRPVLFPMWFKLAGVAAVLALMVTAALWNEKTDLPDTNAVIDSPLPKEDSPIGTMDSNSKKEGVTESRSQENAVDYDLLVEVESNNKEQKNNANNTTNSIQTTKASALQKSDVIANADKTMSKKTKNDFKAGTISDGWVQTVLDTSSAAIATVEDINRKEFQSNIDKTTASIATDSLTSDKAIKDDLKEAMVDTDLTENPELPETDPFIRSWSAATVFAPIYSSTLGGSSIGTQVGDNDKSPEVNLSYGLAIGYQFAPRWTVRTGISQMRMAYDTGNINYRFTAQSIAANGARPTVNFDAAAVNDNSVAANSAADSFSQELFSANTFSGFKGELSQQLGYLEVPLEIKYLVLDRKIGVSVVGGLSALFLTDNQVNLYNSNQKLDLGKDPNFRDFNQSLNLGLGIDYKFTQKLGMTLEPTFKYQLNTLRNDSADFRPYTLGLYTGLRYRF